MMDIDPVQRHLFLEGIFLRYGYDFRQYSEASLNRRLTAVLEVHRSKNLIEILNIILSSPEKFHEILPQLTINTTEFFRDPGFFRQLREKVFPVLGTYPSLRVWSAGCSSGEEVIALAILLQEANLLKRTTIYATDINPHMIAKAKKGIFDTKFAQSFAKNYALSGGHHSPSHYYTADYDLVRFDPILLESVVFSEHNLVTDSVFVEAHLILCRNVLIYFTRDLQNRVLDLFSRSLVMGGFLGLGSKESMRFSPSANRYLSLDSKLNLFQLKPNALAQIEGQRGRA